MQDSSPNQGEISSWLFFDRYVQTMTIDIRAHGGVLSEGARGNLACSFM